jgi:hypothetical protein
LREPLCPRCSTPNPADYVFCDACGARLRETEAPATARPADLPSAPVRPPVAATAAPPAEPVEAYAAGNGAAVTANDSGPALATPAAAAAGAPALTLDPPLATAAAAIAAASSATAEAAPAPVERATASTATAEPTGVTPAPAELAEADTAPVTASDEEPEEPPAEPTDSGRSGNRTLTLTGLGLAAAAELYLQVGDMTNRTKSIGLGLLLAGAILFALGAASGVLPARLRRVRLPMLIPTRVFQPGPPAVAGAVGGLAFLTLIGRLLAGSTVSSDLVLWVVAIVALAMPIVGEVVPRRPSREHLIEAGTVLLVMLVFCVLCARDLNHWYYSAIGDEYAFFGNANGVLQDGIKRPFAQDGVYGAHPVLGTIFQAWVMAVFGRNHFGWVFSSVLSAALAIPAIYLIGRALAGKAVGLIAAALFASCHYIFAFSHIGYNNMMAPTPISWSIAFFALALRYPRGWLLYASGLAAGLGFYTFYSARITMPILALFILAQYGLRGCFTPRGLRDRLLELWPLLLGFVLAAGPIFGASGTAVITRMVTEVPGGYNSDITGPPGQKILFNFWLNVPAFFVNWQSAHYTYGSLLDPVTAVLAALGVGLAIRWWSRPSCKLVLIWTAVAVAVTALLSPHPTTAVTRLMFDVPPLAILAALAARQIWRSVPPWPVLEARREWAGIGAAAALLAVVLGLNLYRFWVSSPKNMHLTPDATVIGALRDGICGLEPNRTIVVMRGHGLLRAALTSYASERELPRFITHEELRPGQPIALDSSRCVIFGDPNDEPSRRAQEDLMRAHPGGITSQFSDYSGRQNIMVFRPAATANP